MAKAKNTALNPAEVELLKVYNPARGDADARMFDYCRKQVGGYCVLANGMVVEFEKPKIQTRFCFGYDCCGGRNYEEAESVRKTAASNEEYFKEKNLKELKETLDNLENRPEGCYWARQYNESNLASLHYEWRACRLEDIKEEQYLTKEDIEALKEVVRKEIAKFEKRLNTYLKKYGLTKLDTWTYWAD